MMGVLVCRTCLNTNVKMFHLDIVANAYSDLTGLKCDATTTEYVCYQCAALLLKFQQFRTKCLRANQVISELAGKITEDVVNMIDRKLHNLESSIIPFEIKEENTFLEFHDEFKFVKKENKELEQSIKIEIDDEMIIEAIEIKKEVEIYYDKDQAVSNENEILHLQDHISLDKEPKVLVSNETKHENKKNQKKSGPPRKKLDFSFMEEYGTVMKLTPEEVKNEILLRKESNNYKSNPYKCDLCYRGFGALIAYENHMKKHNKDTGQYECDYCHIRLLKQYRLRWHIINYHTMKFCCKVCPFTCFNITQAKTHVYLHKGKKYPCEECGMIFSMPNSLSTHQHHKHTTEFVCAICGSTFGKERGLKRHISLIHKRDTNDQKGPPCEECDVHFATETAWKRHLVLSSKHTVINGCEVCGETYESQDALKRHTDKAHQKRFRPKSQPKKDINCTLCGTLVERRVFHTHMRTVHPEVTPDNPYICDICGKTFKNKTIFIYHQREHTGEKPYRCSECGKSYKNRAILICHSQKHSSLRPQCHLCKKSFTFSSSLNRHIKCHFNVRPYKCKVCEKAFPTPCELKNHNKYVHEKVPWPKRDRRTRKKVSHETRESSPASS